jgi:hypothetical protein
MADMVCSRLTDGLVMVVHGRRQPSDREWLAYLRQMETWTLVRDRRMPVQLIFTLGGHPTAAQRELACATVRRVAPHPGRRVVLTNSRSAQTIARIAGLFIQMGELRWFGWDDVESALSFAEIALDAEQVRQERARLLLALT